jgi:hypothetical protein
MNCVLSLRSLALPHHAQNMGNILLSRRRNALRHMMPRPCRYYIDLYNNNGNFISPHHLEVWFDVIRLVFGSTAALAGSGGSSLTSKPAVGGVASVIGMHMASR